VYDCHEFSYAAYTQLFNSFVGSIVMVLERAWMPAVSLVLTVTKSIAAYFKTINPNTQVIYNYPKASDVPTVSQQKAREELGLPLNSFIVASIGEIRYDSTLNIFLAVKKLVSSEDPTIHFLVVGGKGPLAEEILRISQDMNNLSVIPHVPRAIAMLYLVASDLAWVIYRSHGSMSNPDLSLPWKLFDSIACGVPVIVEKGGARANIVKKLKCGEVVDEENADLIARKILSLARDHKRLVAMSVAAKKGFAKSGFNWAPMGSKLRLVYERLVSQDRDD